MVSVLYKVGFILFIPILAIPGLGVPHQKEELSKILEKEMNGVSPRQLKTAGKLSI